VEVKKDKLLNPLKPVTLKGNAIPDWSCDDFSFFVVGCCEDVYGQEPLSSISL
jgi:hypothetical protein